MKCTRCNGWGKEGDGMHATYDCGRCGGTGKEPVKGGDKK